MSITINQLIAHIEIQVKHDSLNAAQPETTHQISNALAVALILTCQKENLNYFPALKHFEAIQSIPEDLFAKHQKLVWQSSQSCRKIISQKLKPIFSRVRVDTVQSLSQTLTGINPKEKSAADTISHHLQPGRLKVTLHLNMIQKKKTDPESLVGYTRKMLWKWLKSDFDALEIKQVSLLENHEQHT